MPSAVGSPPSLGSKSGFPWCTTKASLVVNQVLVQYSTLVQLEVESTNWHKGLAEFTKLSMMGLPCLHGVSRPMLLCPKRQMGSTTIA